MATFFSKDELKEEFISGKPTKGILGYSYLFKIERRVYIRETYKGILGYNYLFKMSVDEIPQDTRHRITTGRMIHENVTGFENVRYIRQKDSTTNG